MTDLITAPAEGPGAVAEVVRIDQCVCQEPVVIAVQAVTFGTAAAVPLPRTTFVGRVIAGLRARTVSAPDEAPAVPRHYPPRREAFIESAAMSREMLRL